MSVQFIQPMAALLVDTLPSGDDWLYEAKFDGYRAMALKDGAGVRILSRRGNDLTADYPAICKASHCHRAEHCFTKSSRALTWSFPPSCPDLPKMSFRR